MGSATEWVGRGSIGWAGAVSAVPLPKSDFQHIKKSEKYWGPRSFGGGQEPYQVGRGSIGCSKSQIIGISKNLFRRFFWLVGPKKIDIIGFKTSEKMCVPSFIDLCLRITKL